MVLLLIVLCIGLIPILFTWVISRRIQTSILRILLRFVVISTVHFGTVFVVGGVVSMDGLCLVHGDEDLEEIDCGPSPSFNMLRVLINILHFPIVYIVSYIPNITFYINYINSLGIDGITVIVVLNSCFWGISTIFFVRVIQEYVKKWST